ncbi:MAG TPA: hypothetical protein VMS75_01425 [Terriglobales bacterium]|nr:hypothetical protein [Terriglobales bacterium]
MAALMLVRGGDPSGSVPHHTQVDDGELRKLDAFFKEPLAHLESLKGMKDLGEKITYYARWNVDRIQEFFRTQYQDIDERKIEILVYLLRYYRGFPVPDEAARVFGLRPVMFARELEKTPEWAGIVKDISWSWESFSSGLRGLGGSDFEKKVKELARSLHEERRQRIKLIGDFVNDAVSNLEEVKKLDDLPFWLSRFEEAQTRDGRPEIFALSSLFVNNFGEINEKKIEILVYLLLHCGNGVDGELLADEAGGLFKDHTVLFVEVLERTREWKSIVDDMYDLAGPDLAEGLKNLGDTPFERELKRYVADKKWGHS